MGFNTTHTRLLAWILPLLLSLASFVPAQARHRVFAKRNRLHLEDRDSGQRREFDMWNTRLANALFDTRFTDQVIANLDDYLRYGVNAISLGIQGGNLGTPRYTELYPRVYQTDGSLKLDCPVWSNLKRLLAETDRRGMVLIVQYWYFRHDENVPTEAAALEATRNVTRWLKETGHRNYMLDLVNEFGHTDYDKRDLFTTVPGALRLLHAVYEVDPDVLAGMSPPGNLFSPEGYVDTPSGRKWVAATVTFSHNQPSDPENPASYYLHGLPQDPLGKPYVNDEFNAQLGYERYPKRCLDTGYYTYGHWDQATIDAYIRDLEQIRAYGGYGNIFSHHQQYLTEQRDLPVAQVGPAGTQPEAKEGGGEPSMHWLFQAIADLRKAAPPARRLDFNEHLAPGLEMEKDGRWAIHDGMLCQDDDQHALAWARTTTCAGDLEIGFDAGFPTDPGSAGRLGLQLGAAGPGGPAYRLLVGRDEVRLEQLGGQLPGTTVRRTKQAHDRYRLTLCDRRVTLAINGITVMDLDDVTPVDGRNLVFWTSQTRAFFDNVRVGPCRSVCFDNENTGEWVASDPKTWSIVNRSTAGADKVWLTTAGINDVRHAVLDRMFCDFEFRFEVDLSQAVFAGLRFRTPAIASAFGDGYLLRVMRDGTVTLDRIQGTEPPRELGMAWVPMDASAACVRVVVYGSNLRVLINDRPALDVVDTGLPLAPGGLVLLGYGGPVKFDNFHLTTGPSLFPEVSLEGAPTGPLGSGVVISMSDPDGALDFTDLRVLLNKDDAFGFQDVTCLLDPCYQLFMLSRTGDGKGADARLTRTIPIGNHNWTLRLQATDHAGNTTLIDQRLYNVPQQ